MEKKLESNRAVVSGRCEAFLRQTDPGMAMAEKIIARLEQVRDAIYIRRKAEKAQLKKPRTYGRKGR